MGKNPLRRRAGLHLVTIAALVGSLVWVGPAVSAAGPGNPMTWGTNESGQLGNGTFSNDLLPDDVNLDDVVDLHGGRQHVVALKSDGTVWTWGRNNQGQLGDGTRTNRNSPTQVGGLSNIISVTTGHYHTLALRSDGTIWSWGYNAFGQLGDSTTTRRTTPVQVQGLGDAVKIAAGRDMSYAIRENGQVWAWGLNSSGQLGDGSTTQRTTPVRTGSLTNVIDVAGGRDHGLAVTNSGTVWAWGLNSYGQVGDGSTTNRTSPVSVGIGNASQVIAGAHHSYALTTAGTVRSWGRNYRSQLGDGTSTQRTSPVTVQGISNAVYIGAGRDHGIAILSNGTARAWGHNNGGELGDGTTTERSSPVTVQGLSDAEIVSGGANYSVALVSDGGPPPNQSPTAAFGSSCDLLECDFDSSSSFDPDGSIVSRSWTFGDGANASGQAPSHTYSEPGTFDVTLTVTDDDGATDSVSHQVTVSEVQSAVAFRAASSSYANRASNSVSVPGSVQAGDTLLLFVTINRNANIASPPAGWNLLGTEQDGSPDMESWLYTRSAPPGFGGSSVNVTLSTRSKTNMVLLAYSGANGVSTHASSPDTGNGSNHETPPIGVSTSGSVVVSYWSEKVSGVTSWSLPPNVTEREAQPGSGGGRINSIAGDTFSVPAGNWPGVVAGSSTGSGKAIMWTVSLAGSGGPPANQDPVADFTYSCDLLACDFNSTASFDPDGSIVDRSWGFGDGSGGSAITPSHTYASPGTYPVSLTVIDDEGASDTLTSQVSVTDGTSSIAFRGASEFNGNVLASTVTIPANVQAGDRLVLVATVNRDIGLDSVPAGWSLLGTEQDGGPDMTSYLFTRTASGGLGGTDLTVTLDARSKTSLILVAYQGAGDVTAFASDDQSGSSSTHVAPSVDVAVDGSIVVGYWSDKTGGHGGWTTPVSMIERQQSSGSGGGQVNAVIADIGPLGPGNWPGATATSGTSASKAISWSIVISPG